MDNFGNRLPSLRKGNSLNQQAATSYGYSTNILSDYVSAITPIGIGKLSSLKSKFELLMGDSSLIINSGSKQQAKLNPLFKYLLQVTIRYDYLNKSKATENLCDLWVDFVDSIPDIEVTNCLIDDIGQIVRTCRQEGVRNVKNSRLHKLELFEQKCLQLWQQRSHQYRDLLYKAYINQVDAQEWSNISTINAFICQNVKKLPPIRSSIMKLRYQRFYKLHKKYFKTSTISAEEGKFSISVSRPSSEPEAVLHTIEDHLYLRKGTAGFEGIIVNLLKDIVRILNDYHQRVSNSSYQAYYNYLNPKTVIFDQFTLKPQLKYQPLLIESLGLRNRPLTFQNKLCFFPTPESFDYFQSPCQVYPQTQRTSRLILNDPFYGCCQLYGHSYKLLAESDLQDIKKEKVQIAQIQQHQMCWQYLLLSYYLRTGKKFGENRSLCNERQIKQSFVNCLRKAEELIKGQGDLSYFVGVKGTMTKSEGQQYELSLKGLLQYLQINPKQQFFEDYVLERLISYHNSRNVLLRQALKILVANNVLQKMFNIKKYMCIFALLACEILEEIRSLVDFELGYQGETNQVRQIFDGRVRRLRNGKTYYEYLQNTYQRILGYLTRRPEMDLQARFIQQNIQGQKHLRIIQQNKEILEQLIATDRILQKGQQQINNFGPQSHRQQCANSLTRLSQMLQTHYWKVKQSCYGLIVESFRPGSVAEYHRIPRNNTNIIKSYSLFHRRLQNFIHALFCFQIDSLSNYESLVLPLLKVPQESNIAVVKVTENEADERQAEIGMVKMQAVEHVIGSRFGCQMPRVAVLKTLGSRGQELNASQGQNNLYMSEKKQGNYHQVDTRYGQLLEYL